MSLLRREDGTTLFYEEVEDEKMPVLLVAFVLTLRASKQGFFDILRRVLRRQLEIVRGFSDSFSRQLVNSGKGQYCI